MIRLICLVLLVIGLLIIADVDGISHPHNQIQHTKNHPDPPNDNMLRLLLVIPGLGRADRLKTVLHNIRILFSETRMQEDVVGRRKIGLDCLVYVYSPREDSSFWNQKEDLAELTKNCKLIEHPEKRVAENLFLLQPYLLSPGSHNAHYHYLFLLLDDIKIDDGANFKLSYLIKLMRCNELSVISPLVRWISILL
jgi:hypothetical protein